MFASGAFNAGQFNAGQFSGMAISQSGDISATFGALTLAGADGRAKPSGATAISDAGGTNLVLVGDEAVPDTGDGVSSGTVVWDDGSTWTVTTSANTLGVKDATELEAALMACTGGETIEFQPGKSDTPGIIQGVGSGTGSAPVYSSLVTITSQDVSNPHWIQSAKIYGASNLLFTGLKFGMSLSEGANPSNAQVLFLATALHATMDNIQIIDCDFESAPGDGTDQARQLAFTGRSQAARASNIVVRNNRINGGYYGTSFVNCSGVECIGNVYSHMAGDGPFFGACDNVDIGFNSYINPSDDQNSGTHQDWIQIGQSGSTTDYDAFRLFGNYSDKLGSPNGSQNIFVQDHADAGAYYLTNSSFVGNFCRNGASVHGLSVYNAIDALIAGNGILHELSVTTVNSATISIASSAGTSAPSQGGDIVYNYANAVNISDALNVDTSESNNVILATNDQAEYDAALTDFNNVDPVLAAQSIVASGPLDTTPIKTGPHPDYIDFTNRKVDHPAANGVTVSNPADLVDQATDTLVQSAWVEVTGITKYYPVSEASVQGALIWKVSGGEFRSADDGTGTNATAWGSANAVVTTGKFIQFRQTTSVIGEIETTMTARIGKDGLSWAVATEAAAPVVGFIKNVGAGGSNNTPAYSLALTSPTNGTRLVLAACHRTDKTLATPAGWSLIGFVSDNSDGGRITFFDKISDGTETSVLLDLSAWSHVYGICDEYSGMDVLSMGSDNNPDFDTTLLIEGIAVDDDELTAVYAYARNGGDWVTTPTGDIATLQIAPGASADLARVINGPHTFGVSDAGTYVAGASNFHVGGSLVIG